MVIFLFFLFFVAEKTNTLRRPTPPASATSKSIISDTLNRVQYRNPLFTSLCLCYDNCYAHDLLAAVSAVPVNLHYYYRYCISILVIASSSCRCESCKLGRAYACSQRQLSKHTQNPSFQFYSLSPLVTQRCAMTWFPPCKIHCHVP